jgi:hypothetical protein
MMLKVLIALILISLVLIKFKTAKLKHNHRFVPVAITTDVLSVFRYNDQITVQ